MVFAFQLEQLEVVYHGQWTNLREKVHYSVDQLQFCKTDSLKSENIPKSIAYTTDTAINFGHHKSRRPAVSPLLQ